MDPLFTAAAARGRALLRGIVRSADAALDRTVEAFREQERERERARERERDRDHGSGFAAAFAEDRPRRTEPEAPYTFREEWKELLVYTEPGGTYTFLCGWGKRPYGVGVPTAEHWDDAMPAWMHGRRDEILGRIAAWAGGRYVIDEYGPSEY